MDMKEVMKGCKNKLERIAFLKDNCDKVIEKSYSKNFTPAELQQYKEKLVEVCDKIDALEDKKKSTIKEFKLEIDPLQSKRKEMIGNIRSKAKLVTEDCYMFTDAETRTTSFYNDDGDLVETRQATADELQAYLFPQSEMRAVGGTHLEATGTEGK